MPNFHNHLKNLVREKKNDELKAIIARLAPADLIDKAGLNLLHVSAKFNNLSLIRFLLKSGYDLKSKCSAEKTPLFYSIRANHFEAAKILLEAGTEFSNGEEEALKMLLNKNKEIPDWIFKSFFDVLDKSGISFESKIEILLRIKCPMHRIVLMNDLQFTIEMLHRQILTDERQFFSALECAALSNDLENVIALLNYGSGANERKMFFLKTILKNFKIVCPKLMDILKLQDDRFQDETFGWVRHHIFEADKVVKGIRVYVDLKNMNTLFSSKFWPDLWKRLMTPHYRYIFDMLLLFDIDENALLRRLTQNYNFKTFCNEKLKLLLDMGANPNILRLTLFLEDKNLESTKLLLQHGADIQYITTNRMTAFDDTFSDMMKIKLAHLAIEHHKGVTIKERIQNQIDSSEELKSFYDNCCLQIEELKTYTMGEITLFSFFVRKPEELIGYVCVRSVSESYLDFARNCNLDEYLYSLLERSLNEAVMLYQLRLKMSFLLADVFGLQTGHLVVERIMRYIGFDDLIRIYARK